MEIQRLINKADGIIYSGGGDIDPCFYAPDVPRHPKLARIDKERDQLELEAVSYILGKNKPFLAICRGMQVLNIALGGDLYQDIDDERPPEGMPKNHQQLDRKIRASRASHDVIVEKGSLLHKITGKGKIRVNSTHHQGVKRIAPSLKVTGVAPDGLVEAIEKPGSRFLLAVQFHPEKMWRTYKDMHKIFLAFKEAVEK